MNLIYSRLNPKLEVRNTGDLNKGVFASVPLEAGEKLAPFGGHVIRVVEVTGDYGI